MKTLKQAEVPRSRDPLDAIRNMVVERPKVRVIMPVHVKTGTRVADTNKKAYRRVKRVEAE